LEVEDAAHNDVVLHGELREVVVACPEGAEDQLDVALLRGQPASVVSEGHFLVDHILRLHVRPEAEQQVLRLLKQQQLHFLGNVTFAATSLA